MAACDKRDESAAKQANPIYVLNDNKAAVFLMLKMVVLLLKIDTMLGKCIIWRMKFLKATSIFAYSKLNVIMRFGT